MGSLRRVQGREGIVETQARHGRGRQGEAWGGEVQRRATSAAEGDRERQGEERCNGVQQARSRQAALLWRLPALQSRQDPTSDADVAPAFPYFPAAQGVPEQAEAPPLE